MKRGGCLTIICVIICGLINVAQGITKIDSTQAVREIKARTFNYFWKLSDPVSGFVPDRAPSESFSSIAATGFGLAAIVTGIEEGYISREEGAERVAKTLQFLRDLPQAADATAVAGYHGFFYHFVDMHTGYRFKDVELSTIDTGLLMAGILVCYTYFDGDTPTESAIRRVAYDLYSGVEWDWAMQPDGFLSMGWTPEHGFIDARWKGYNEAMILLVLAMGSPTHPVGHEAWEKWTSGYEWADFYGNGQVCFGPLFGHQYSHIFIDFRGIKDEYMKGKGIDYFENSRRATLSQQVYCIQNPGSFNDYSSKIWGLSACDGPGWTQRFFKGRKVTFEGYSARGVAPGYHVDDGTLTPTAAGGSVPFAPEICLPALLAFMENYDGVFREFGFKDALNPSFVNAKGEPWIDADYLGIDQGPILLMIQNYEKETIWNILKKNQFIVNGLRKAGFTGGWLETIEKPD